MKRLIGDHRQIFCPALISLLRVQQLYFHEYPHVIPPAMRNAEAGNGILFLLLRCKRLDGITIAFWKPQRFVTTYLNFSVYLGETRATRLRRYPVHHHTLFSPV